jgi:glycosyltransferase involved in cell wall biosynthesis
VIATILPAFNEPRDRLLASVASALEVSDLVVVADDGSREPIAPIDGVEVVRHPNAGPAAAMNRGVEAALSLGATRIARLDVGDHFLADAKRRQLALTAPAIASWHVDLVESKTFVPLPHWRRAIYWDGAFCICTCVVSADVWREVGGFDESLRYGDDWDWSMRVEAAVGWTMHEEPTCAAGAFDGGHTKSAPPVLRHECMVEVLRRGRVLRGRA